ncbi:TetR family transcriptional regulator [Chloroflexi bacterium TSY]|nr:TetR family transcriptional regulator [Chloroflexi bacterium TSY]
MATKPYENIKVSELVQEADIARTTFYKHYETKDHLLFSLYDDVFRIFQEEVLAEFEAGSANDYLLMTRFFQLWAVHAETFALLIDAGLDLLLLNHIRQFLERTRAQMREVEGGESIVGEGSDFALYVIDSTAGSLFMVLKRWVQEGMMIPVEDLGQFFGDYSAFARQKLKQ